MKILSTYIKTILAMTIIILTTGCYDYQIDKNGRNYGIVDEKHNIKIPYEYKKIYKNNNKYYLLKNNIIEIRGKRLNLLREIEADEIYFLNEHNFMIKKGEQYFVDVRGKLFEVNHQVEQVYDKYIVRRENGKAVVSDIFTNEKIFTDYDGVYIENKKHITVEKNRKYGVVDINNNVKVDIVYDQISPLIDKRYYIVEKDYKSGVINEKGEILIPFKYDTVEKIEEDYAIVYSSEGVGVVNLKNEIKVPCIYDNIEIKNNDIYCYLNKKVEKIVTL